LVLAPQPVLDVATLRRCLPGVAECDGEQLSAFVGLLYVRPRRSARLSKNRLNAPERRLSRLADAPASRSLRPRSASRGGG
jgi:hypothetical protein